MKNKQILGMVLLLATAIIFGASLVFQIYGAESLDAFSFCGARMTIAAVALGIVVLIIDKKKGPDAISETSTRDTILGGISCGIFLAAGLSLQQIGLPMTTASKAGFIGAMYIILVPVCGALFFRKKNTTLGWISVAVGFVGLFLLCVNEKMSFAPGDLIIMCSSVCYGFHLFSCDHFSKKGDPIKISAIQMAVAAIISWVIAFAIGNPSLGAFRQAVIPILYCGVLASGAGYTLQMVAQKYVDPVKTVITLSSESVFSMFFGVLLLNEQITMRQFAGSCMMLFSIIIVQLPQKNKAQ